MQSTSAEGAAALGAQLLVPTKDSPTDMLSQPEEEAARKDRALDQMLARWAKEENRREAAPRVVLVHTASTVTGSSSAPAMSAFGSAPGTTLGGPVAYTFADC